MELINYEGRIYESNNFGKFKIIKEAIGIGYAKKERLFEVEFLNTGYRTVATLTCITHGAVKDKSLPVLYGFGYLGFTDYLNQEDINMFYVTWKNMLSRCYNPQDKMYQYYGGANVTVDPSWHCFATFFEDIKHLSGYERKVQEPNKFKLDKDFLQLNIPKSYRKYSKDTCLWVSIYENAMIEGVENNQSGYYGVVYASNYWYTRVYHENFGRFKTKEEAANLFNYIYPKVSMKQYVTINLFNNVIPIPFETLLENNLLNTITKEKLRSIVYGN